MTYLDQKDQIRLALALYVVKHRGNESIDEFVKKMRSRFRTNRLGIPPSIEPPSSQSSLTQKQKQKQLQSPVPSLLGLWNNRPFPLSDRQVLELDILLQEAPSICSEPDLVRAGSIIGTLVSINQILHPPPVQDAPSSSSPTRPLKKLTLRLVRTLHVLLLLALALDSSKSRSDLEETSPGHVVLCLGLILQTTLREVLPRLSPDDVTMVCRFIGREIFSEVAKALSDRISKGRQSRGGKMSRDDANKTTSDGGGDSVNNDSEDEAVKATFPLLRLLYALVHLDSALLGPLIRSLLSSLSPLFPSSPNFLSISSSSSESSPSQWNHQTFEIGLLRDVLNLLVYAIKSTTDPFPLSPPSLLLPPSGHRRRPCRPSRFDPYQNTRTRSRRTGRATRSVRPSLCGSDESSWSNRERQGQEEEEKGEDEAERDIEGEESGGEEEETDERREGSIWLDLGRFCRHLHYTTTRSTKAIRHASSEPNYRQDLERVVFRFLENVWTIEGDRSAQ